MNILLLSYFFTFFLCLTTITSSLRMSYNTKLVYMVVLFVVYYFSLKLFYQNNMSRITQMCFFFFILACLISHLYFIGMAFQH